MSRWISRGYTIFALVLLVIGCAIFALALWAISRPSQEDRIVMEQAATIDMLADCYSKVVDKTSYDATLPDIGMHKKRLSELDKELTKLGPERREAVLKKHDADLKEAQGRYKAARVKAAETAWGVKPAK